MGDNPTTLAALKVLKRLTESEESRTGALEKQTNANTKRRNPSPRRNVAKKPPISHPIGLTLDEAIGGVLVNDRQQNQEKNLLESNIFNRLKDGETGSPPANQKPLGAKSKERKEKTAPQNAVPPPERKEKCPPIFVKGDPPGMRSSLRKCIARGLRCTFRLCTDGVKIITDEKSHYQMVLGFLDERKYETRPPALNEVNFPQLAAGNQPSTAELPRSQWPPIHPPGFRKQQGEALPAEDALPPYTSDQLVPIYKELVARLRSCKTRIDQIYALGLFVIENGF
ncbi:AAEL009717-PA [Aedes aegypti]|uniref:AAEL009717-PA n=1 Tax=Aedes aegypti TaxID=7159 RepID=Q16V11_AEDAE|nr:AAEL009717-PA [Aedes aegypti]